MVSSRSLLVFSRDPGPTNLLIAVLEALSGADNSRDYAGIACLRSVLEPMLSNPCIVSRPPGAESWREAGFAVREWHGRDEEAARLLIEETGACTVLTGTSDLDESGDRALWRAARAAGLESHALLDHPANLIERFTEADGTTIWPDWLYVPDEIFADRLVQIGVPRERMRPVGDLHHVRVRRLAASRTPDDIRRLRLAWGADDSSFVLLFVSECTFEMSQLGYKSTYLETEVLDEMLRRLSRGERPDGGRIDPSRLTVVVRPHPRDTDRKYDHVVAGWSDALRIATSSEAAADLAILAADLTVGMNSSMLYEAVILGRPAVSLTGHDIMGSKSLAV